MDKDKIVKMIDKGLITHTMMFDSDGELYEKIANMEEEEFLQRYLTMTGFYESTKDDDTEPGPDEGGDTGGDTGGDEPNPDTGGDDPDPEVTTTYGTPVVTLEYDIIPAEGGVVEPTYSYSQTYESSDGTSGTIENEDGTLTFTSDVLAIDENTGAITVDANETTDILQLGTATLTVTMNDETGSATTTLTQAAGETQKVSVTSIDELKEALENGASYIVIDADMTASESISITSDVVIDLNGHTLTRDDDTSACAMFIVSGGTVEFTGSGTVQSNGTSSSDWVQALWVNNESATVNLSGDIAWKGGIWDNLDDTTTGSSACIYCEYGTVNIYAGSYECGYAVDMKQYSVLNCLNSSYNNGTAHINVYGGTYKNFNPADNTSEGSDTNFVAEGYESNETSDGVWVVTSTIDPASISTLSASASSTKKSKKSKKS